MIKKKTYIHGASCVKGMFRKFAYCQIRSEAEENPSRVPSKLLLKVATNPSIPNN